MDRLPTATVDGLRDWSKRAFGQELRLQVMLVIGRDDTGIFSQTDVAQALGVRNASSVQRPLDDLVFLGLVHKLERDPNSRVRWLQRLPSDAWAWAEELMHRVEVGLDTSLAVAEPSAPPT